jgi:hypothetical protein
MDPRPFFDNVIEAIEALEHWRPEYNLTESPELMMSFGAAIRALSVAYGAIADAMKDGDYHHTLTEEAEDVSWRLSDVADYARGLCDLLPIAHATEFEYAQAGLPHRSEYWRAEG